MHRWMWDLHYPRPAVQSFSYPIAAVYRNTERRPYGPWVLPGTYSVRLTVNGKTYTRPITVKMDPRVKTPALGLRAMFSTSMRLYDALDALLALIEAAPSALGWASLLVR